MRRPAAGAGARHVAVGTLGGRRRAVAHDRRRAVIAAAEGDARDVEFGAPMRREIFAGALARRGACGRVVLELRYRLKVAERIGEALRVGGVAHGERLTLDFVSREQLWLGATLEDGGELPAEIRGVFHRGVVAEAAGRREEMRGVAADEDATLGVTLGDERVARGPGIAREHCDLERRADRLLHHRRGRALVDL